MATTQQILDKARELGKLIGEHDSAKKFEATLTQLQDDADAQRALTDYNRHLQTLGEKEANGQPIEVDDKKKLETLQKAVVRNRLLRDLQTVQMDYLDLMRQVDEALTGAAPVGGQGAASSPLVNPDLSV